jgi:23S rRNA (guanosine2251-2'-O)-methyltransferase
MARVVQFLRESGLRIFAATEKTEDLLFTAEMTGPLALILGSEEKGISGPLLRGADQLVAIPMKGKTSSLNVSVAAGVLLFEVLRQRSCSFTGES